MIDLLNQYGALWVQYGFRTLPQNTLFLIFILIIIRLLRGAPAGLRYNIGLLGLAKLLLPPFIKIPILKQDFLKTRPLLL